MNHLISVSIALILLGASFPWGYIDAISATSISIHELSFKTLSGQTTEIAGINQQVLLSSSLHNNENEHTEYVTIFDIRNEQNISVKIALSEGDIGPGDDITTQASWTPDKVGSYLVREFVISNQHTPEILSAVIAESVTVGPEQIISLTDEDEPILDPVRPVSDPEVPNHGTDHYTILVYMVASDLESQDYAGTRDISEMIDADIPVNVNVIVQTGGSANATIDEARFIDFTKVQRHQIINKNIETIVDLGESNMGSSQTLGDFIIWSMEKYPSEHYAIIMWDHGNGIRGFGMDDIFNDYLTLREISDAFSQAKKKTTNVFEFLGFDACLMATYEVAYRFSPYTHYLVASEEVVPGWGWDYSAILSSLENSESSSDGYFDGEAMGKIIADSYKAHSRINTATYDNFEADRSITLSVIDLSKIHDVKDSMEYLGDFLWKHMTELEQAQTFARTIQHTERYGTDYGGSAGYADLYQLAENVGQSFPGVKPLADSLMRSVQEAIVYNIHGDAKPNAHGMSIFMQLDKYEPSEEHLFYLESEWLAVIETSAKKLESDTEAPEGWLDYSTGTLEGKSYDEDISYGFISFYKELEGSKYEIVSYYYLDPSEFLDENRNIDFSVNQGVISLCADDMCVPAFVYLEDNGDTQFAYFPVRLEYEDYNERITLIYEVAGNDFIFIGGWEGVEDGTAQRGLVPLQPGDKISTFTGQYDENDPDYYLELESEQIEVSGNFGPAFIEYDDQEFTFDMAICDFADNCATSTLFKLT